MNCKICGKECKTNSKKYYDMFIKKEYDAKDKERQKEIEREGWKFIRYRDFIPNREELVKNINVIRGVQ